MNRRQILLALTAAFPLLLPAADAQTGPAPQYGDDLYRPNLGQAGKDVIWMPTPDAMVTRMLTAVKTTKDDLVYDLGSGDGKIAIAAAREFGARAVGIEYNPDMAALAQRNAQRAGVADRAKIIAGDIFVEDFSAATVVTMYLLPELNLRLRPTLLKMKPGTRLVSYQFHMREWEADEVVRGENFEAYVWTVPAQVAGRWTLAEQGGGLEGTLELGQQFQRIGGTLTLGGRTQPVLGAYVAGAELGFTFVDRDGEVRRFRAKVDGNRLEGTVRPFDSDNPIKGRRGAESRP